MYRPDKNYMRDPSTVSKRIYIGNLDESVTKENLEELFKKHGNVLGVDVHRGFGFIQYEEDKGAQLAIQNQHGVMFQGRKLNVKQAIDNKNKGGFGLPPNSAPSGNDPPPPGIGISLGPNKPGMGGLPQKPDGPPPRKRGRGGMIGGWGVGRGGGGIMPMDRDPSPGTDDRDYRGTSPYYGGRDEKYTSPKIGGYVPPPIDRKTALPVRNDCEIIVVSKMLTEFAEYIEHRLKSIGLTVDLLFPNEDVPIGRVLANISSRGCLYAILVMPINEEHRSLTLNILHGIPQEHRNMPVDDAIQLIARNFDTYVRGEKSGGQSTVAIGPAPLANERHPEAIQILLNLLADNRQLTTLQYDRVIKYLQDRREFQYKQEVGEAADEANNPTKEAELQNRIMNILNKTGANPAPPTLSTISPNIANSAPKNSAPILNDPSVQKALDSLLQGNILKNISGNNRF